MGYTHYWTFKKPQRGDAQKVERAYQRAIKACNVVIRAYNDQFERGDFRRLSGFSAHSKGYGGLQINGRGAQAHEDFMLREHFKQNFEPFGRGFHFCKTARKPYDVVVVACLIILKKYLGSNIVVGSDGQEEDWKDGQGLVHRILGKIFAVPAELADEESEVA